MKAENLELSETADGEDGTRKVLFCVAATSNGKNKMAYFYSHRDTDAEAAMALAALCLEHTPMYHRWHSHTVDARRTFAYLMANGRTYFAVADPTPGSAETVRLLGRVWDAHNAAPRKRPLGDALAPVVLQFASALEAAARAGSAPNAVLPGASLEEITTQPSAVGVGGKKDEEARYVGPRDRAMRTEEGKASARRLWWRDAAVVIGLNVVLCLFLLAVWLGVCHGFRCVSRR